MWCPSTNPVHWTVKEEDIWCLLSWWKDGAVSHPLSHKSTKKLKTNGFSSHIGCKSMKWPYNPKEFCKISTVKNIQWLLGVTANKQYGTSPSSTHWLKLTATVSNRIWFKRPNSLKKTSGLHATVGKILEVGMTNTFMLSTYLKKIKNGLNCNTSYMYCNNCSKTTKWN